MRTRETVSITMELEGEMDDVREYIDKLRKDLRSTGYICKGIDSAVGGTRFYVVRAFVEIE